MQFFSQEAYNLLKEAVKNSLPLLEYRIWILACPYSFLGKEERLEVFVPLRLFRRLSSSTEKQYRKLRESEKAQSPWRNWLESSLSLLASRKLQKESWDTELLLLYSPELFSLSLHCGNIREQKIRSLDVVVSVITEFNEKVLPTPSSPPDKEDDTHTTPSVESKAAHYWGRIWVPSDLFTRYAFPL